MYVAGLQTSYTEKYCRCTQTYEVGPWCATWSRKLNITFCVLHGFLAAQFCPGARLWEIDGEKMNEYISSHHTVCQRSSRK